MPALESSSWIVTVVIALFSAGVTWGIMRTSNKNTDKVVHETISELKDAVKELKSLSSDLQVTKATTADNKQDIKDHELRITHLEINVAKLQAMTE